MIIKNLFKKQSAQKQKWKICKNFSLKIIFYILVFEKKRNNNWEKFNSKFVLSKYIEILSFFNSKIQIHLLSYIWLNFI